jgi:hypothetical protein
MNTPPTTPFGHRWLSAFPLDANSLSLNASALTPLTEGGYTSPAMPKSRKSPKKAKPDQHAQP